MSPPHVPTLSKVIPIPFGGTDGGSLTNRVTAPREMRNAVRPWVANRSPPNRAVGTAMYRSVHCWPLLGSVANKNEVPCGAIAVMWNEHSWVANTAEAVTATPTGRSRSEEHTSELQSPC